MRFEVSHRLSEQSSTPRSAYSVRSRATGHPPPHSPVRRTARADSRPSPAPRGWLAQPPLMSPLGWLQITHLARLGPVRLRAGFGDLLQDCAKLSSRGMGLGEVVGVRVGRVLEQAQEGGRGWDRRGEGGHGCWQIGSGRSVKSAAVRFGLSCDELDEIWAGLGEQTTACGAGRAVSDVADQSLKLGLAFGL